MSQQKLKSKGLKRAENNLLNKFNTTFLKNYPHHVMPGYNLNKSPCIEEWDEESAMGLYQDFPYNCNLPKPLLPPARLSRTVLIEEDPALQLLTLKQHLKDDIDRIMGYYERHKTVAANITPMKDSIWKPLLQNSAKCRILGRHRNQCTIYMLTNSENHMVLNEIHRQASKVPYVSADLSLTNVNYHCTLSAERKICLWDINNMHSINSGSLLNNAKTYDAWGCIRFQQMDPNVLIYMDRCCLHYVDIRTAFDQPCLTLCPKFNLENCENLSVEAPSKHNCCRYVGTYHSLLLCDNRSPKHCIRQKWTHQFKDTPLLATVTNNNDKEIIVLSSQKIGENAIILNTWMGEEESHSFNLPFIPPCIVETLNESQIQGMCLNPYLRSRFELSNTGSTLVTNTQKGEVSYFVQNSIGDIFYQCITHENILDKYSPVNGKACYALNMWEKALSAQAEPLVPLTLSNKCNMRHIYENFTNKKLCLKSNKDDADDFEPSWKQSLATLGSYIDLLAPELLTAWEIREEVPVPETAESHHKVWNWLESSTSNYPMMQSEDDSGCISTFINTQEFSHISQEQDLIYIEDDNVLQ
ncbi:hypothetical protein EAG_11783 [Camponotus floridanus]|uniref:Uncharacterized protein n=1 Tax=Camponotus floridanus TaxID=104421 RepID=E2ARS2_CAMFO|nr:hypothetical protein EAG_11783 [Camponotus floridanus]